MGKSKGVKIKVPLFPATVWVWFSMDDYEADTGNKDFPHRTAGACTWPTPGGADIVFGKVTMEYIAHEAVHAAWACLDAVGVKSGSSNQEPLAYVTGFITQKITEAFHKWAQEQDGQEADSQPQSVKMSASLHASKRLTQRSKPSASRGTGR